MSWNDKEGEREKSREKKLFVGARLLGSSNGLPEVANLPTVEATQEWGKKKIFQPINRTHTERSVPHLWIELESFSRMKSDEEQSAEKNEKRQQREVVASGLRRCARKQKANGNNWMSAREVFFLQISSSLLYSQWRLALHMRVVAWGMKKSSVCAVVCLQINILTSSCCCDLLCGEEAKTFLLCVLFPSPPQSFHPSGSRRREFEFTWRKKG